jgi:hypothetical protein
MLTVIGTSRTIFPGSTAQDLRHAIESCATTGYGPTFNPVRLFFYARKVPEIKERDRDRKAREAERGVSGACAECGDCDAASLGNSTAEER